eukprot:3303667-Rhodomonas_salina.1
MLATGGSAECLQTLIEAGADVNATTQVPHSSAPACSNGSRDLLVGNGGLLGMGVWRVAMGVCRGWVVEWGSSAEGERRRGRERGHSGKRERRGVTWLGGECDEGARGRGAGRAHGADVCGEPRRHGVRRRAAGCWRRRRAPGQ